MAGVVGAGISYLTLDVPTVKTRGSMPAPRTKATLGSPEGQVSVSILGDGVNQPGEYEMDGDSRVVDLVRRAGGLKNGALTDGINWRADLYDGLRMTVPTAATIRRVREGDSTLTGEDLIRFRHYQPTETDTEYVNVNRASAAELQSLSGIGPVLSNRIIRYREENGSFRRIRHLKRVSGIGEVTLQQIRPEIDLR